MVVWRPGFAQRQGEPIGKLQSKGVGEDLGSRARSGDSVEVKYTGFVEVKGKETVA